MKTQIQGKSRPSSFYARAPVLTDREWLSYIFVMETGCGNQKFKDPNKTTDREWLQLVGEMRILSDYQRKPGQRDPRAQQKLNKFQVGIAKRIFGNLKSKSLQAWNKHQQAQRKGE